MDELVRLLTVERRLLGRLLGTVRAEGGVRTADLEQLRLVQLHRGLVADELATADGVVGDSPSLPTLIRISEEPFRTILADHHAALTELASRVAVEAGRQAWPMPALADFLG